LSININIDNTKWEGGRGEGGRSTHLSLLIVFVGLIAIVSCKRISGIRGESKGRMMAAKLEKEESRKRRKEKTKYE